MGGAARSLADVDEGHHHAEGREQRRERLDRRDPGSGRRNSRGPRRSRPGVRWTAPRFEALAETGVARRCQLVRRDARAGAAVGMEAAQPRTHRDRCPLEPALDERTVPVAVAPLRIRNARAPGAADPGALLVALNVPAPAEHREPDGVRADFARRFGPFRPPPVAHDDDLAAGKFGEQLVPGRPSSLPRAGAAGQSPHIPQKPQISPWIARRMSRSASHARQSTRIARRMSSAFSSRLARGFIQGSSDGTPS